MNVKLHISAQFHTNYLLHFSTL